MAITHCCCCGYADGIGVHRFCELCTAGSIAVGGPIGARFALELVGHARQRDHGELCRIASGIVAVLGSLGDGSRRSFAASK